MGQCGYRPTEKRSRKLSEIMSEKQAVNYPDVLGFITKGEFHSVGPVQMALAIRPPAVKAGKPFEVIMVMQNTIDAPVDVILSLQLPNKDAKGQKDRFLLGAERLVVGLESAEVGYAMLPMSSLPDTAPSDNYTVGMDVSVKALHKGERIRDDKQAEAKFNPKTLPADRKELLRDLINLKFSTQKRGFLRGNALETPLTILPGKIGSPLKFEAGWQSLWTVEDATSSDPLLDKYREMMLHRIVPLFTRKKLYKPIKEKVAEVFADSNYPLTDIEVLCITKLMVLIMEYAQSTETEQGILEAGIYNIEAYLKGIEIEQDEPRQYPYWLDKFLRVMVRDERVMKVPIKGLVHFAFFELMHDAMIYGFQIMERQTGMDLGTIEEMESYATNVRDELQNKEPVTFSKAYVPLVLGGVIAFDRVMMSDEKLSEGLDGLRYMLNDRVDERDDDNEMFFDIAKRVISLSLQKYGSLDDSI